MLNVSLMQGAALRESLSKFNHLGMNVKTDICRADKTTAMYFKLYCKWKTVNIQMLEERIIETSMYNYSYKAHATMHESFQCPTKFPTVMIKKKT